MLIQTKFNPNDTIYYIGNSRIEKTVIDEVVIRVNKYNTNIEQSYIYTKCGALTGTLSDKEVYATKQEAGNAWMRANDLEVGLINK